MKKQISLAMALLLVVLSLLGCGVSGGSETPKEAVGGFIVAIKEGNYEEAKQYLSSDAKKMYEKSELEDFNEMFTAKDAVVLANPDRVEITGDTATEPISVMSVNGSRTLKVNLIKKSNKWFISSISK